MINQITTKPRVYQLAIEKDKILFTADVDKIGNVLVHYADADDEYQVKVSVPLGDLDELLNALADEVERIKNLATAEELAKLPNGGKPIKGAGKLPKASTTHYGKTPKK